MEIDELTYDVDNIDIEEQMIAQDIEDEEAEEEAERERVEEEAANKTVEELWSKLSAKNLELDLTNKVEDTRRRYKFSKDNVEYSGYVIYKMDKDTYIFSVNDPSSTSGKKSKKFKLSEIKLVKY